MFNKRCVDKNMDMKEMMSYTNMGMCAQQFEGIECPVVYECPIERVCHREICHHVPHVC